MTKSTQDAIDSVEPILGRQFFEGSGAEAKLTSSERVIVSKESAIALKFLGAVFLTIVILFLFGGADWPAYLLPVVIFIYPFARALVSYLRTNRTYAAAQSVGKPTPGVIIGHEYFRVISTFSGKRMPRFAQRFRIRYEHQSKVEVVESEWSRPRYAETIYFNPGVEPAYDNYVGRSVIVYIEPSLNRPQLITASFLDPYTAL